MVDLEVPLQVRFMRNNNTRNNIVGGLPNVVGAMKGWQVPVVANYIKQMLVDDELIEVNRTTRIFGVLQPLKAQEIQLKPEGERAWPWYQLHVEAAKYKRLRVGQDVDIKNENFRVMAAKNYNLYGYIEYHLVREYDKL